MEDVALVQFGVPPREVCNGNVTGTGNGNGSRSGNAVSITRRRSRTKGEGLLATMDRVTPNREL